MGVVLQHHSHHSSNLALYVQTELHVFWMSNFQLCLSSTFEQQVITRNAMILTVEVHPDLLIKLLSWVILLLMPAVLPLTYDIETSIILKGHLTLELEGLRDQGGLTG